METKLAVVAFCASEDEAEAVQKALSKLKPSKPSKPSKPDTKPAKDDDDFGDFDDDDVADLPMPTAQSLKKALIDVRDELGNDALRAIFKTHGAKNIQSLKKEEWPAAFAEATKLLKDDSDDDDDWGDLGDDDDIGTDKVPTAEEVKDACQAYAKENGKTAANDILSDNGLNTVRGLKKATDKQLIAILKAVS